MNVHLTDMLEEVTDINYMQAAYFCLMHSTIAIKYHHFWDQIIEDFSK